MSLQVSNQTTSGRRTPQVYQGFGGVVGGGAAATTPSATNGSGAPNANSGSVGRSAKGGNKQSQIPVAIGSGAANASGNNGPTTPVIPQTAVVYPGTGGSIDGQKHQSSQLDHVYGMVMKQSPAAIQPTAGSVRTQPTNGSQPAAAAAAAAGNVAGEKNGPPQKKNAAAAKEGGTDGGSAAKKLEAQQQATTVPVEVPAKVRDSPRSRAQQKSEEAVAPPKGAVKSTDNSLLSEKPLNTLHGPDGEEMESLLLEPFDLEEELSTPQGGRSTAGTKSQKATQKTTPQAQVSPFKAGGAKSEPDQSPSSKAKAQDGAGTNRSPKATDATPPATPTAGDSLIGRPLRSISGRRSTRPISDIKFTHHRRSTDQHNDSFSSLNVTVGSEVGNNDSLLRTPLSASRKRKDMTPESTSDGPADSGAVDSPKRARFSGFFDLVATPVTMLKNRLSRVMLQSTPCMLDVEEEDTSKVVTAEATTTTTVTPQKDEPTGKVATETASMEVDKQEKPDADAAKDAGDQQESASTAVADDEVEVKIVTEGEQQQKQRCSIM